MAKRVGKSTMYGKNTEEFDKYNTEHPEVTNPITQLANFLRSKLGVPTIPSDAVDNEEVADAWSKQSEEG